MKRTRQERIRLAALFAFIVFTFSLVALRLFHFQVVNAARYSDLVNIQTSGTVTIPAERGAIFDRNGQIVANNVYCQSLFAYPENNDEVKQVAAYIEKKFGRRRGTAIKDFGLVPGKFRWIKREMSDAQVAMVEASAPRGLYLRREPKREYPFGAVGKQIVGFTDIDDKGRAGIEYSFDSLLAGGAGEAYFRRDGRRKTYRVREQALVAPTPGRSMVLTADWPLQEIVEEELKTAVTEHDAGFGMAAFIDCNSGDILAMAHFDPSEKNREKPVKARVISDQWEPGSIFKVFAAAALMDREMVDFAETTYCEMGKWKIGRLTLHDDKDKGWLNFRQIMEYSSNIGISKHAIEMGGEEVLAKAEAFGLGQKVLECLPGETAGSIKAPPRWSEYNTAAFTIGHSMAVSTLQMANAFAAIANGGELLKPNLIYGFVDENGYVVRDKKREVIRRAMKKSSADSLKAFLRGVVEHGTGEPINSPAVSIAGKTGTAQVYDVVNKRYYRSKYMASFAGFFPAEHPLVAGIVVIGEPHPIHYGGYTAGPAFKKIAERYTVLNPDLFASNQNLIEESDEPLRKTVEVPNLEGYSVTDALARAERSGLRLRYSGNKGNVVWQFPAPDRLLLEDDELFVLLGGQEDDSAVQMIDLKGLSVREAAAFCGYAGLNYEINGSGVVVKQTLQPGASLNKDSFCRLICKSI